MFQGKLLKIGVAEQYEAIEFVRDAKYSVIGYRGTIVETTKWLARRLNFTYEFVPLNLNVFSTKKNGTWDNTLGALQNRVDYLFIANVLDHERAEDFEMAGVIAEEGSSFVFAAPKAESRLQSLVSPFDLQVWLSLLAVMVLIPLILRGLLRAAGPIYHETRIIPLSKLIMYIVGIVLNQGEDIHSRASRHNAVRITVAVFLLSTIVFGNAYLSGYISCNTFPKMKKNPTSFEEIAARSDLHLVLFRRENYRFYTENPSPTVQKIAQDWIRNGRPGWDKTYFHEATDMIASGRYYINSPNAIFSNITTVDEQQTGQCRFERGKNPVLWTYYSFLTWKGNTDAKIFRLEMMRLRETGLIAVWRRQMYNYSKKCLDNYKGTNKPPVQRLTLRDTQGPFIILGAGCSLAILFFLFAWCNKQRKTASSSIEKRAQSTSA